MPERWLVLALGLLLATAGCLGAEPEPASRDDAPDGETPTGEEQDREPSNRSEEGDERSDEPTDNETGDGDGSEGSGSQDTGPSSWPDLHNASIRPGVQITASGQCTSNFLFRTPDNATLMLGVAAHCVADAPQLGSDGCRDDVDPMQPGTEVEIEGASQPGVLVYSSWWTMQAANVTDATVCNENDFALVAIHPDDRGSVHPAVQDFGGPTGLADGVAVSDEVQWYGSTSATPDSRSTNQHRGTVVASSDWSFEAYSAAPGVPGDSGSGVMLADGSAAGVLVTVETVYPAANGVTKLGPALAFAEDHGANVELVTWPTSSGPLT